MEIIPFDQRDGDIWMNGEFIPWASAKVHILSHALHYASAVFEGNRAYGGKIFKLEKHTQRLIQSSKIMDFEIPFSEEEINSACNATVKRNSIKDGYVRPIAWRGPEQMGVSAQGTKINLAIATWEWPNYYSSEDVMKGLRMDISKWQRPSAKSAPCHAKAAGLYMICTLSKHAAERAGYNDALMYDHEGNVAETTGANIFFIKDGEIHTPIPDSFLNGITRRTVISLAEKNGVKVIERKITSSELSDFSECFITGTAVEVTPISEIKDFKFVVGNITKKLMRDYADLVRS
jgi:branched-chain amino acid aminotransferase